MGTLLRAQCTNCDYLKSNLPLGFGMMNEYAENFVILDHKRKLVRSVVVEHGEFKLKERDRIYFHDVEISRKKYASQPSVDISEEEDFELGEHIHKCPMCESFHLELILYALWD